MVENKKESEKRIKSDKEERRRSVRRKRVRRRNDIERGDIEKAVKRRVGKCLELQTETGV